MIVTQTPLRVSFFGGGTDFAGFYEQEEGCVLSTAIDKYIFVIVKRRFDAMIRVGYTRTELVESVDQVEHELVRESLRKTGVSKQIEVSTLGDIPSAGSGLGSSSTVTVGLLNALYTYLGEPRELSSLAEEACEIEIERLKKPIGKQDQYIAALGGLRFIRFLPDGTVKSERVHISDFERRMFNQNLMLFFTNSTRRSESVLTEQRQNIRDRMEQLHNLKEMAYQGRQMLDHCDFDAFGHLLHQGWKLKKELASKVSNDAIDEMYTAARKAGAFGGKITGAGGGGFLLLYCPVEKQTKVREALSALSELPFRFEADGSKVIFNYQRSE